jgi:phytoene dehydrogenase-like protein
MARVLSISADLMLGSRFLGDPLAGGMPRWKYVSNRFLTGVENLAFGLRLSEYHTGLRAYSRRLLETIDAYAQNFRASILGRQIFTPLDLERTFGLVGGDIFHGALDLGQIFSARPMLGHADYRGPIEGLYMCGSGTHPGGGVTGAPGHNAAQAILADRRWRAPWRR